MNVIKQTKGEMVFNICNYIFLSLMSLIFILPFILVVSTSFVTEQELIRRGASFVLWPREIHLEAYQVILSWGSRIYKAYGVTIYIVVVGTFLNLLFTSAIAYGLSKRELTGRNFLTTIVFLTMMFNGGLVPTYLVVTMLGMSNSLWALIIPGLISPWNMFLMRNFFMEIPESVEESALVEGATPLIILVKIIIPLSLPAFTTIGLFYAVAHWNSWFNAVIYINDSNKLPLQVLLRNIIVSSSNTDLSLSMLEDLEFKPPEIAMRCATIVITTLPILMVYPFIQKYFVKGVMVGSIKG